MTEEGNKEKYIKEITEKPYGVCLYCNGHLDGMSLVSVDVNGKWRRGGVIQVPVKCFACDKEWTEIYTISDIKEKLVK